jgi:hypothetical protein
MRAACAPEPATAPRAAAAIRAIQRRARGGRESAVRQKLINNAHYRPEDLAGYFARSFLAQ